MSMHFIVSILILLLSYPTLILANDGEGTADIAESELVAGSKISLKVDFTVGSSGIATGGGIALCFHHASSWPVQINQPTGSGYTVIEGINSNNFDITYFQNIPSEMLANPEKYYIFHKCLVSKIKNQILPAGTRLAFVLGANNMKIQVHKQTDNNHEFRILTDVDGNGTFKAVGQSPHFNIVAAPARQLVAVAPSVLQNGQTFQMQIRAEDEYFNVDKNYLGNVTITERNGQIVRSNITIMGGKRIISLPVKVAGPHCYTISDGELKGRSNPVWVFNIQQPYKIFWGDIHGHTDFSDGLSNDPYEYFNFAKNESFLDVAAVTDHAYYNWPVTQGAIDFYYNPGKFVTLLGFEGSYGTNHFNFYYKSPIADHISRWPFDYSDVYDIIYNQYNVTNQEILIGPHHFTYHRATGADSLYPFGLFDQNVARFVEVYSTHGASEYFGNPRPLPGSTELEKDKFMQTGLAKGLKFGVLASSDDHNGHPGRSISLTYPGGLVAFLAKDLTREAIWISFWNRRVYGTSFERIFMMFTLNTRIMGSTISAQPPYNIRYIVNTQTDDAKVFLIRNNHVIKQDNVTKGALIVDFQDNPITTNNFYYVRVEQNNGERAWSSPIWVNY